MFIAMIGEKNSSPFHLFYRFARDLFFRRVHGMSHTRWRCEAI